MKQKTVKQPNKKETIKHPDFLCLCRLRAPSRCTACVCFSPVAHHSPQQDDEIGRKDGIMTIKHDATQDAATWSQLLHLCLWDTTPTLGQTVPLQFSHSGHPHPSTLLVHMWNRWEWWQPSWGAQDTHTEHPHSWRRHRAAGHRSFP